MKNILTQTFLLFFFSNTLALAQTPIRKLTYDNEYTADQILNGKLPRRKSSPPANITYDTVCFAKERLYHVPALDVHPLIFFAPQDLPRIKKQLADGEAGRQMLGYVREQLATGIDKAYNFLTPDDARQVRSVLSKITKGRYTLGMEFPAHWRNWNYMGISMYFPLYLLAIEGEEGDDSRIYKRWVEVVRDFITYSINPSGMAHEAVGYHTSGFVHTTETMLAMANRGDNLFTHANFRRQFDAWMLNAMQPFGKTWYSDGDLANSPPSLEAVMVTKYFFPTDKKLDFVYQNIRAVSENNFRQDFFLDVLLLCPADPDKTIGGNWSIIRLATYLSCQKPTPTKAGV